KNGEERVISWENSVVRDDGQIVGTLSSGIDITERKQMEKQIREDKEELRQSFIELAETTSRVLGVRDPYTQEHEQRVAELSREVGKRMDLTEDRLLGLYIGGMLHDIGKIVVPETILTKPGELKDVEWEMIRSHPKVGYNQILEGTDFPWPVAEMTLHHHERLDGSGYPDGLEGDELTTEVRILGAVDVVEAMSTRRPYREARSKERTLNVLQEGKGEKFDPDVVDILVEMVEEGEIEFG
ncbi:HD-GYP domain-containing protein, partial [Candidatus Bipolaricaulota bacterium]|nr:HD-GYP domain-containing protein [Candidatus Bipolaricaulota bacterium]